MLDRVSPPPFKKVQEYIDEIRKIYGNIPIAVHANKVDIKLSKKTKTEFKIKEKIFNEQSDVKFWLTSTKSCYNLYSSIEWFVANIM